MKASNVLTTHFYFWVVASAALIFMIVLTAPMVGTVSAVNSVDKVQSGLLASDSLTTGNTTSWTFGGTATIRDVYEDSQGLHIGIRSPQSGQWVYYHAQRHQPNAYLFHSTLTIQDNVVSDGVSDLGLYVVGSDFIPNVSCGAYADWSGYYWTVGRSSNAGQTYEILYISGPNKRPQTQDCTIITNGDNYLKVYLGGELVFSNTTMNLGMSSPFIAAFNDDTSSSNSTHYAIYRDYYATADENIKVINNPSNAAGVRVVNSLGQIISNSTVSNGVATLDVGKYRFPLSATINVYDSNDSIIASSPASIYGGDVFSVTVSSTVPQPPTGLTAAAVSSSQINLSWIAPTDNGGSPITGYRIQRSTDNGTTWSTVVSNTNSTATTHSDTGLAASTAYSYRVSAINAVGTSSPSNTASALTQTVNNPPTADDDSVQKQEFFAVQPMVDSLDFARFKQTIQNITSFGPRQQGTQTNAVVLDWLEGQLASMGYDVNRHNFTFNGEPRQSIYATKIGATKPNQMYIISAHIDSVFGSEAADDNGSGMSLLLETARAFANLGIKTDTSVRFIFFNNEETNLAGSIAYVQDRAPLQGIESPPGSGLYPEPTWLGHITHDMILYDHGIPPQSDQSPAADIDIEFRGDAVKSAEGSVLAKLLQSANSKYSVSYPAEIGPLMCCTDTWPFRDHTASVSIRENQAFEITLNGSNPHWDKPSDVFSAYSEADFQLGFDIVRMTAGMTAEIVGATAPITINVLANDSDPDGDALSVTSTSTPSKGTASINANNTITYTPNQSFVGTDSFRYTISDGTGETGTATVTITITAVNKSPVAAADSAVTNEDTSVTINVLANDSDPNGDTILLDSFNATSKFNGIITRDNNGTQLDKSDDRLVYTPPANGFGTDSFNYTISDGNGETDAATVTITVISVNDPPVANNDSAQTDMNASVTIAVLANDTDIENNPLSVTSTTTTSNGTALINSNNTITYSPNSGFSGTDSFNYTMSDGNGGSASATVTVTVTSVNDPSVAADDSAQTDTLSVTSTGILVPLFVFPFNDTSWQPLIDTKTNHPNVPMIAVINPSNGSGTVQNPQLSEQIPRLQAVGIKILGYVATDWANKTIDDVKLDIDLWKQLYPNIEGIFFDQMSNLPGNESYYAELDAYTKSKDGFDLTIGNPGVDTIPSYVGTVDNIVIHENGHFPSLEDLSGWHASYDKGNFSFVVHTQPQLNASQIVSASNHVSYLYVTDDELDPPADEHDPWGTISSHIEVLAESLDRPSVAIRIDSRDLAGNPIIHSDPASDNAGSLVISSGGVVVRAGPSPLVYNATNAITYAVSAVDFGNFTFAHWENFDENNTRTITPLQDTALIAFYNNAPVAANDSATTNEDVPVTVAVLANDTDIENNPLSVTSTSTPSNGTALINSNNTITYSPKQGFSGTDSFTYTISDGNGGTDTATVTVTVSGTLPPPATVSITVQSADLSGTTFEGMWLELWQNGQLIQTGFTPFTVQIDPNTQYVVDVANSFENIVFDHWENGSTNTARVFSISQNATFTAFYQTGTAP